MEQEKECTHIYVLFKEYVDAGRVSSRPYILGADFGVGNDGEIVLFKHLLEILRFFDYEKVQYLYDQNNLKGLLFALNLLSPEYPTPKSMILSQIKRYGLTDWKDINITRVEKELRLERFDVTDDLLGCAAIDSECSNRSIAIINIGALQTNAEEIEIKNNIGNRNRIRVLSDVLDTYNWLKDHRKPQRVFNINPKHGTNLIPSQYIHDRHGSHKAAQLETDIESAKLLLKKAIGVASISSIWAWDSQVGKYIYFEFEGDSPSPSYHGYHLVQGDENYDNIDRKKVRIIDPDAQ